MNGLKTPTVDFFATKAQIPRARATHPGHNTIQVGEAWY